MKIDIHTHILPEHLPRWSEKFGYGGFIHLDHHKPCCARMLRDDEKYFREVEENYIPSFPEVMQLSDRDINSIRQVLSSTIRRHENQEYAGRIARKVQDALKIETTLHPVDFMELLLKDYNHLSAKG